MRQKFQIKFGLIHSLFNHTNVKAFAGSKINRFPGICGNAGSSFDHFSGIRLNTGSNFCYLSGISGNAGSKYFS
ncbi:hypothetical protein [Mucilaginibacter sp.]|uniref:hypothetical protein n=1 Tax=Mucilaginibacter sp. TaxID=1882438 RepID=UPI0026318E79|nr:hypothetical protein [Mucilaginibacter sp.]